MSPTQATNFPSGFLDGLANRIPGINVVLPSSEHWDAMKKAHSKHNADPGAIVRPQNEEHVQKLVQECLSSKVDFTVRSGGHDVVGRSHAEGALTIDMRDINAVKISQTSKTASLGGGILTREMTQALQDSGYITPSGPIASIGHVGWATLGGYGQLSGKYGIGADQIVGARYVNAEGNLVEANEEALTGFRGGGPFFGVITELTVKIYPLTQPKILAGSLSFAADDKTSTWVTFTEGLSKLTKDGNFPDCLTVQPTGLNIPGLGNVFVVMLCWTGEDLKEGQDWVEKIAALGICVRNAVNETTWPDHCEANEKLAGTGGYGRAFSINLRELTATTAAILGKHNNTIPGPGMIFSAQLTRGTQNHPRSVFQPRGTHYWLEIVGISPDPETALKGEEWASNLRKDLLENDPDNVLDSTYLGFMKNEEQDLKKMYGNGYEGLLGLKKQLDAGNIFRHSLIRFEN